MLRECGNTIFDVYIQLLSLESGVALGAAGGQQKESAQLKDTVELLDDFVALAGGGFEFLAAENFESATAVLNDFFSLEDFGCEADAGAIGSKHRRKEIVGDGQGA